MHSLKALSTLSNSSHQYVIVMWENLGRFQIILLFSYVQNEGILGICPIVYKKN